jgi:hypothetical protein
MFITSPTYFNFQNLLQGRNSITCLVNYLGFYTMPLGGPLEVKTCWAYNKNNSGLCYNWWFYMSHIHNNSKV